jgi:hypothetical protein
MAIITKLIQATKSFDDNDDKMDRVKNLLNGAKIELHQLKSVGEDYVHKINIVLAEIDKGKPKAEILSHILSIINQLKVHNIE